MKTKIEFRAWDGEIMLHFEPQTDEEYSHNWVEFFFKKCIVMQCSGINDKNNKNIYADDLMKDSDVKIFRIYHVPGGFAIKAKYWMQNCKDLILGDDLILESLTDPQIKSWIEQCEIIGNIFENPELI